RIAVRDLQRDPADGAGDHRLALPERFRDGEPESLAQRLLQDDRRGALDRVDLDVRGGWELDDVDVRVAVGAFAALGENLRSLRVVGGRAADEEQLSVVVLARETEGFDDAEGILQAIEA